jgi:hypothetical protein
MQYFIDLAGLEHFQRPPDGFNIVMSIGDQPKPVHPHIILEKDSPEFAGMTLPFHNKVITD